MAVLELINNIYQGFENNEFTVGIFVDLKKYLTPLIILFYWTNLVIMVYVASLWLGSLVTFQIDNNMSYLMTIHPLIIL